MEIKLYEHNQTAYEAALAMLMERGKAAVIHPTGTGKSFIAFKLAQDHPEARICWLAPSEYIYSTQLENLNRTLPKEEAVYFPNICFWSYSRLIKNRKIIEEAKPDYIILDEFHRCGGVGEGCEGTAGKIP